MAAGIVMSQGGRFPQPMHPGGMPIPRMTAAVPTTTPRTPIPSAATSEC